MTVRQRPINRGPTGLALITDQMMRCDYQPFSVLKPHYNQLPNSQQARGSRLYLVRLGWLRYVSFVIRPPYRTKQIKLVQATCALLTFQPEGVRDKVWSRVREHVISQFDHGRPIAASSGGAVALPHGPIRAPHTSEKQMILCPLRLQVLKESNARPHPADPDR